MLVQVNSGKLTVHEKPMVPLADGVKVLLSFLSLHVSIVLCRCVDGDREGVKRASVNERTNGSCPGEERRRRRTF